MSEVQHAYDAAAARAQIEAQQTARARLVEEAPPFSKAALFDVLVVAGIQCSA